MANYSYCSIHEAAMQELCIEFIKAIKHLDSDLAAKRLNNLFLDYNPMTGQSRSKAFKDVASEFVLLTNHKTCVD